jgi:hypothetical protein
MLLGLAAKQKKWPYTYINTFPVTGNRLLGFDEWEDR